MIKLDIFLVLFTVGYFNTVLIPDTKKVLKDPLYLGDFMRWVGCWFYVACWVEIPDRRDCWSVTTLAMNILAPFHLKKYTHRHRFDEILASLRYKNREVNL